MLSRRRSEESRNPPMSVPSPTQESSANPNGGDLMGIRCRIKHEREKAKGDEDREYEEFKEEEC